MGPDDEIITWISVKEKTPEEPATVMTLSLAPGGWDMCRCWFVRGEWKSDDPSFLGGVTYWAKLPKGPPF